MADIQLISIALLGLVTLISLVLTIQQARRGPSIILIIEDQSLWQTILALVSALVYCGGFGSLIYFTGLIPKDNFWAFLSTIGLSLILWMCWLIYLSDWRAAKTAIGHIALMPPDSFLLQLGEEQEQVSLTKAKISVQLIPNKAPKLQINFELPHKTIYLHGPARAYDLNLAPKGERGSAQGLLLKHTEKLCALIRPISKHKSLFHLPHRLR